MRISRLKWIAEILTSFPDAVANAFEQFFREHTNLNSRQMAFLKLLKDFIVEREKVEKRDLIQSPFTVIHPQGIRGVFTPAVIVNIRLAHVNVWTVPHIRRFGAV
ncbi:MAG: type I restriction-modification enzyme R subunit C-terminal domain-containing protein [Desulfobacterium sp.]